MANFAVPNWHRNFEPARYVFVIDVRQEQLTAARNELADMLRQKVCQGRFRMDQSLHRDGSVPVPTKHIYTYAYVNMYIVQHLYVFCAVSPHHCSEMLV